MECLEFLRNCVGFIGNGKIWRLIRQGCKLTKRAAYAGLLVFLVPSVLCNPDWSSPLTFSQIFNDTQYVHLQHTSKPYSSYNFLHFATSPRYNLEELNTNLANKYNLEEYNSNFGSLEDVGNKEVNNLENKYNLEEYNNNFGSPYANLEEVRGNELEYEEYDISLKDSAVREPLLVGFSHDPYRYSIPEDDYLKGVRHMTPKSIMGKGENRGKRGVLHLYNMMYCATGCEPLAYKGYGCYCGFLGSGRPTDGIDRCCKMHDECYENIYCPFFTVYFQPYYWKCYKGQPLCAKENYHTEHQFINGCAARLCECDRKFAMCVKRYPCPRRRALCRSSPIRLLQNLLMFR